MKFSSAKQTSSYQGYSLLATVILFFSAILLLTGFALRTHTLTRKQCYTELSVSTKEAMQDLETHFRSDRVSLRMLASMLSQEESLSSINVSSYLDIYDVNSLISNIGILTPENTCIQLRGKEIDASGVMDYQKEVLLGEHISNLQPSLTTGDSMVVRSFMPIRRSGKTIGLLYAEMTPSNIARAWSPSIYNGSCTFCIISRETGELIVNNWNKNIHYISDLDSESLQNSILEGKSAFREMQTEQGDVFLSYMPMELENWEIMVSVRKEEVFSSADEIEASMKWFLAGIMALLSLYLAWMLRINHYSVLHAKKQANIDILTGLQNRNCYENYCEKIKSAERLACIYIDANGLHELNNTKGHLAGDQMLRFIADTLKIYFGEDTVYRIGGDEFIVFDKNQSDSKIQEILEQVKTEIERNQYHISAGYCLGTKKIQLKELIKTAEIRMYEEKKKYYEKIGRPVRNHIKEGENIL
ncbi:MAG: GGDEF domain-containing protein [Oscillospiraceae bacterium]|nr:GGDEF domain-containing protein [Oscillospiraceae bacterium]